MTSKYYKLLINKIIKPVHAHEQAFENNKYKKYLCIYKIALILRFQHR
jgi:hypothetical protein